MWNAIKISPAGIPDLDSPTPVLDYIGDLNNTYDGDLVVGKALLTLTVKTQSNRTGASSPAFVVLFRY